MPVHSIKNISREKIDLPLILVCPKTGLPRLVAGLWLSLYEQKYSIGYATQHLRSLDKFYMHIQREYPLSPNLDKIILDGDIDQVTACMSTFVAELQNYSAITGKDQSSNLSMTIRIICSVLNELRFRYKSLRFDSSTISRKIASLRSLYQSLRPPRLDKHKPIRSLPQSVVDEVFEIVRPDSRLNPYRSEKNRQRNFIIFAVLFHMGLRRGELLNLTTDSIQTDYDYQNHRQLYWLNVRAPNLLDTRGKKPQLKNFYSPRQIPLQESLYFLIVNFTNNYRGRCPHGFLFSSQQRLPLSERALNNIFERLSSKLSIVAKDKLQKSYMTRTLGPHNLRHTSAVDRIRYYRHSGIEMDLAESFMRAFFGWSPKSTMPMRYARAFYEEQLNTLWPEKLDKRISDMMGYEYKTA